MQRDFVAALLHKREREKRCAMGHMAHARIIPDLRNIITCRALVGNTCQDEYCILKTTRGKEKVMLRRQVTIVQSTHGCGPTSR